VGALLARKAFTNFGRKLDYSEYGGAPLLGLKGVAIVGHGRSNANAIKNAIRVAKEFYESGINTHIAKELSAARTETESLISAGKTEESA
jgi:phosphate acyltransferase